jgi:transposase
MSGVGKGGRYPDELRERAVRMVFEHQGEYPSQWRAIVSIAEKLDVHRETLRVWVRRAEIDDGGRPGLTTDERARMRDLERENKELRRANEILKRASAFMWTPRLCGTDRWAVAVGAGPRWRGGLSESA